MDERVRRIIDEAVARDAEVQQQTRAAAERRRESEGQTEGQTDAHAQPNEGGSIAGFWVRVVADALDAVFLFVAGWTLSLPFHTAFARLGERGVFVGLAISLAYTGVLQSRLGGGQTLGKRLLGLRVVRLDGTLLSLDRSLVRYALMGVLVYQGAVAYALAALLPFLPLAFVQTVFVGIAGTLFIGCVLVVPFHPLKRGLHDLLAGTIVIRGALADPGFIAARTNHRRDRGIVVGAAALALLATVASLALSRQLLSSTDLTTMRAISCRIQAAGLSNVGVVRSTVWNHGGPPIVTMVASGFVPRPDDAGEPDWNALEAASVAAVKAELPANSDVDGIETALRTGFNIGIYKSYEVRVHLENARTGQVVGSQTTWHW
jgi:uncharacterized RDD family membrane protein YckC